MEHKDVRAKLKEYTVDELDKDTMREMEIHIETCVICKKELLLWQEVIAKQKENARIRQFIPSGTFRERINYRMNRMESEKNLPPLIMRMKAIERALTSTTGRMIIQMSVLLLGFLWLLFVVKKGTSLLSLFFLMIGFGALFFLILKRKKK